MFTETLREINRYFLFWTGNVAVPTNCLSLLELEQLNFQSVPGFTSRYSVSTMTQRTSQNQRSLIQTVSHKETKTVDRNTHIFHLVRVRECASVRTYTWHFHKRILSFGYWEFLLSSFCHHAFQFGRGTQNVPT